VTRRDLGFQTTYTAQTDQFDATAPSLHFTLPTGVRDGALVGIKLTHDDLADNSVFLDARARDPGR
jgi:hypothetical protein